MCGLSCFANWKLCSRSKMLWGQLSKRSTQNALNNKILPGSFQQQIIHLDLWRKCFPFFHSWRSATNRGDCILSTVILLDISKGLWDGAAGSRFGPLTDERCAMCTETCVKLIFFGHSLSEEKQGNVLSLCTDTQVSSAIISTTELFFSRCLFGHCSPFPGNGYTMFPQQLYNYTCLLVSFSEREITYLFIYNIYCHRSG